jgi:uncharacterized membrane protein YphA (DoxX/SURF4 family)
VETLSWILQIVMAVIFAAAGLAKLTQPKQKLAAAAGMEWVEDVDARDVRRIGALELAAAAGLILPSALGILPWLTAAAAAGVVLLMIGAAKTHASRGEMNRLPVNGLIAAMAVVVAITQIG